MSNQNNFTINTYKPALWGDVFVFEPDNYRHTQEAFKTLLAMQGALEMLSGQKLKFSPTENDFEWQTEPLNGAYYHIKVVPNTGMTTSSPVKANNLIGTGYMAVKNSSGDTGIISGFVISALNMVENTSMSIGEVLEEVGSIFEMAANDAKNESGFTAKIGEFVFGGIGDLFFALGLVLEGLAKLITSLMAKMYHSLMILNRSNQDLSWSLGYIDHGQMTHSPPDYVIPKVDRSWIDPVFGVHVDNIAHFAMFSFVSTLDILGIPMGVRYVMETGMNKCMIDIPKDGTNCIYTAFSSESPQEFFDQFSGTPESETRCVANESNILTINSLQGKTRSIKNQNVMGYFYNSVWTIT